MIWDSVDDWDEPRFRAKGPYYPASFVASFVVWVFFGAFEGQKTVILFYPEF